jgi:hypothetical protein
MKKKVVRDDDKVEKTLGIIAENTEFLVCLPWNGADAWFKIFMLNATQLTSCGNFSLIKLESKNGETVTEEEEMEAILDIKNAQENMLKLCLVKPSFNDVVDMYEATDTLKRIKEQSAQIRARIEEIDDAFVKAELKKELNMYDMFKGFLFPDDFAEAITEIIYQKHNSDILKVSEKMLLKAAFLAENGKDNPHDHISGMFTKYHEKDIDEHAWYLLSDYRANREMESSSGKWYRGK